MKKIIYTFLFILTLFIFNNKIYAADYFAKCVYKNESSGEKVTIEIDKQYQLKISSADVLLDGCESVVCYEPKNEIPSDSYNDEDGNISCERVPKIYIGDKYKSADRSGAQYYRVISLKEQTSQIGQVISTEYSLDSDNSEVIIENPDKHEESNGWFKTCHYGDYYLKFSVDPFKYEVNNPHNYYSISVDKNELEKIISDNNNSCPNFLREKAVSSYIENGTKYDLVKLIFSTECEKGTDCTPGSTHSGDYKCGNLDSKMKIYNKYITKLNTPDNISIYNKNLDEIKLFCDTILANEDYESGNNCVKECLSIEDIISKNSQSTTNVCGFSERLLSFFSNILRWVKYILPAIVIVLGILDFIKAMGSDKEDEMKKAQGRFIKRLIAAALVFIVPLILEFVLDKMGFSYDSCGLF